MAAVRNEFQKTKQWNWTILRPQLVFGVAAKSPLNIIAAIGTYASISRELGIPLRFPGGVERIGEATAFSYLFRYFSNVARPCPSSCQKTCCGHCPTKKHQAWAAIVNHPKDTMALRSLLDIFLQGS